MVSRDLPSHRGFGKRRSTKHRRPFVAVVQRLGHCRWLCSLCSPMRADKWLSLRPTFDIYIEHHLVCSFTVHLYLASLPMRIGRWCRRNLCHRIRSSLLDRPVRLWVRLWTLRIGFVALDHFKINKKG